MFFFLGLTSIAQFFKDIHCILEHFMFLLVKLNIVLYMMLVLKTCSKLVLLQHEPKAISHSLDKIHRISIVSYYCQQLF